VIPDQADSDTSLLQFGKQPFRVYTRLTVLLETQAQTHSIVCITSPQNNYKRRAILILITV
jgi:hypothetical protein